MTIQDEDTLAKDAAYHFEVLTAAKASIKGIGDRKFRDRMQACFEKNNTPTAKEIAYLKVLYLDVVEHTRPYGGAYATPVEPCPYCGNLCEADWVDVGVGLVQCGPYHCLECGASEQGPHDDARPLSEQEKETGWYAPGAEPGSSANVLNGEIVSTKTALDAYVSLYPLSATNQGRDLMRKNHSS